MKFKFFYFLVFFQLMVFHSIRAQVFDHELDSGCRYAFDVFARFQHQPHPDEDSSSSKISVVPIVAFGLGGLITGGIIGAKIDQGGPFEITQAEKIGIAIGTAVGVTVGYVLAKRKQDKSTKIRVQ